MSSTPYVIDQTQARELLARIDVPQILRKLFRDLAAGNAVQPAQQLVEFPQGAGDFINYLGVLAEDAALVAESKGCTLTCSIDPSLGTVFLDPRHFEKILLNLVSNAIKFTPAGGTVPVVLPSDDERHPVRLAPRLVHQRPSATVLEAGQAHGKFDDLVLGNLCAAEHRALDLHLRHPPQSNMIARPRPASRDIVPEKLISTARAAPEHPAPLRPGARPGGPSRPRRGRQRGQP